MVTSCLVVINGISRRALWAGLLVSSFLGCGSPPQTASQRTTAVPAPPEMAEAAIEEVEAVTFQGPSPRTHDECACQNGEAASCSRAANLYAEEREQRPYHQHGCALGDPDACFAAARSLSGDDAARRFANAAEGFRQRCLRGDVDGCAIATQILQGGWAGAHFSGTLASLEQARVQALIGNCAAGDAGACYTQSIGDPTQGPALAARAAELYEAQCRSGDGDACVQGAMAYFQGRGIPEDRPRAVALWDFGLEADDVRCDAEDIESCQRARDGWRVSIGRSQPRRAARAARRADRVRQDACDSGEAAACASIAAISAPELGDTGEPSRAVRARLRADELLLEQCEAGQAQACSMLGERCIHGANFEPLLEQVPGETRNFRCALMVNACPHDVSERETQRLPRCNLVQMQERSCAATLAFIERACDMAAAHFRSCREGS